jgi:hypothetical protein
MKRPAFQFYPADWRNNAKLRRCSWAARGAWVDVLGLMHDSDEYGVLRWPLADVISAIGCPSPLVRELAAKGVLKGTDKGQFPGYGFTPRHGRSEGPLVILIEPCEGPLWYSSRFVRDEYIRQVRGAASRFTNGAQTDAPNPPPNPPPNTAPNPTFGAGSGDGASSASSSSVSKTEVCGLSTVAAPVDNSATGKPRGDKSPKVNGDNRWAKSNQGIEEKAKELGINPPPGEGHDRLRQRCYEAIANRYRGTQG